MSTTDAMNDEMQSIVREFLVEAREMLDRLDQDFVALEVQPDDRAVLDHVFRVLHTLKGTCGFLGFGRLEAVAHAGEHLLDRLRERALVYTPDIASALLAAVDVLRALLTQIEATGQDGNVEIAALKTWITSLAAGDGQPRAPTGTAAAAVVPPVAAPVAAPVVVKPSAPPEAAAAIAPRPVSNAAEPADLRDGPESPRSGRAADESIRVDVGHLERLINLVGELVLARNQILQHPAVQADGALQQICQRLSNLTTELQEGVMKTRMQPIGTVFNKLPRVVRDLAMACGKQVRIDIEGRETELDRTLVDAIKDPLTHVIRNCVDHGIEAPEDRRTAGKADEGVLSLRAFHEAGQVIVEVADDGAGIAVDRVRQKAVRQGLIAPTHAERMSDREVCELIFLPGFSTRDAVTNLSGRGVGMDVVRTNIERIGGSVDLDSRAGHGMTLRMKLPLTLAIIPVLIVGAAGQRFAIPQVNLVELVSVGADRIETLHGARLLRLRETLLPLVDLQEVLGLSAPGTGKSPGDDADAPPRSVVIVSADGRTFGLLVDDIDDTQEIVVKPLNKLVKSLGCFSGATILGDGDVALILDVPGLAHRAHVQRPDASEAGRPGASAGGPPGVTPASLLVVTAGARSRLAVPLDCVSRLEETDRAAIERSAGREAMRYRDRVLPLLDVGGRFGAGSGPRATDGHVDVVVVSTGGRSAGLLVDGIVDIVEEVLDLQSDGAVPGTLGTAIVQGRVTDVLDVPWLLTHWTAVP
jgi:two-component system chemotaxis sensor kinase CheA